jgi:hypothetical protein
MDNKLIDQYVETLCLKGCSAVREDINLLKQGVSIPELDTLSDLAKQAVLDQLCEIMAVYGDTTTCPNPKSVQTEVNGLKDAQEEKKTR